MQAIAFLCMVGRQCRTDTEMWTKGIFYSLLELDISPEEIEYCIAQLRVADSMDEEEGAEFIFPRKDGS